MQKMNFLFMGDAAQLAALQETAPSVPWSAVDSMAAARNAQADAFFNLSDDAAAQDWEGFHCPVFINSALSGLPNSKAPQLVGINGWPFFLQKTQWEIAGTIGHGIQAVLEALGKTGIPAPDGPGLISARVIAMVINEAYFALEDGVSTKADIDTAMKLGTNYPYGPFEWAAFLGIRQVYQLLDTLAQNDVRCTPAPLLQEEALA
jgi:3-hydroxybutyryl-CoA dehydrogenase